MVSKIVVTFLSVLTVAALALVPLQIVAQSGSSQLDAPKLRESITNLGYEVKDLATEKGKEKYEFKVTKGGLDIYLGAELSGSKNYIWLTAYLGKSTDLKDFKDRAADMLLENSKIQPCQFYVTDKSSINLAIAIDNRGVDAVVMKRCVDKLGDDVVKTQKLWQQ